MEKKPCEYAGGSCYEMPDVGCDYHGEEALKNKTGYYAVTPMPNKEPTKEWENLSMKASDVQDDELVVPIRIAEIAISQAIQEAVSAREAELIERVRGIDLSDDPGCEELKSQVIALIKE